MSIEDELEELQRRIAHMRGLLRDVTDERTVKALQDLIADANHTLEKLAKRSGEG
jgi:predicted  nucleic acid-binding Zn-ribbon protein